MNLAFFDQVYSYRQLCIKKDLRDAAIWGSFLENIAEEIGYLLTIEKQLIKKPELSTNIQAFRREVILFSANLCKYEQDLNTELEYGKEDYNERQLKLHEAKRYEYVKLHEKYNTLKKAFYQRLSHFKRR